MNPTDAPKIADLIDGAIILYARRWSEGLPGNADRWASVAFHLSDATDAARAKGRFAPPTSKGQVDAT